MRSGPSLGMFYISRAPWLFVPQSFVLFPMNTTAVHPLLKFHIVDQWVALYGWALCHLAEMTFQYGSGSWAAGAHLQRWVSNHLHFNREQHGSFLVPVQEAIAGKKFKRCSREDQAHSRVEWPKAALGGTKPFAGEEGQRGAALLSILAVEPYEETVSELQWAAATAGTNPES